jgi:hypothetical protein
MQDFSPLKVVPENSNLLAVKCITLSMEERFFFTYSGALLSPFTLSLWTIEDDFVVHHRGSAATFHLILFFFPKRKLSFRGQIGHGKKSHWNMQCWNFNIVAI